jgi:hypothetical protein
MTSQSHRICVADSSSSRHLSQMESSVNPRLKRYPFRWQCPVKSPIIHLNWSLFNFNRSFVLLAEGPGISPSKRADTNHKLFSGWEFSVIHQPKVHSKHRKCLPLDLSWASSIHSSTSYITFNVIYVWVLSAKWLQDINHYESANKNAKNRFCLSWNRLKRSTLFTG